MARDDVLYIIGYGAPTPAPSSRYERKKQRSVEEDAAYVDRPGKEVAIMWQPGSKRRPVVE